MEPLYVRVHPRDNVAIIVNAEGVASGSEFAGGLTARERIPQSHKIALRDLQQGESVIRYGQVIGRASHDLRAGVWVREESLQMPVAPDLDSLPLATEVPEPL